MRAGSQPVLVHVLVHEHLLQLPVLWCSPNLSLVNIQKKSLPSPVIQFAILFKGSQRQAAHLVKLTNRPVVGLACWSFVSMNSFSQGMHCTPGWQQGCHCYRSPRYCLFCPCKPFIIGGKYTQRALALKKYMHYFVTAHKKLLFLPGHRS